MVKSSIAVLLAVLLAVCVAALGVRAQESQPAAATGNATGEFATRDTLSQVETLRLQIVALQQTIVSLSAAVETCRIEVAHPGYRYDASKGLVKKP